MIASDPELSLSYRIYRQEDAEAGFVLLSQSANNARVDGTGIESAASFEVEAAPWLGDPGDEEGGQ